MHLHEAVIKSAVELALAEDLGDGDITTNHIFTVEEHGGAAIVARQEGIIAGLPVAMAVFKMLDAEINFKAHVEDSEAVSAGAVLAEISGKVRAILSGERTALNFLQQMSGIATKTHTFVRKAAPYGVKILDTRKTVPGLRVFAKYAVRMGGGYNHRFGLYDAAMIKDNHIQAAGSIKNAVSLLKVNLPVTTRIEVETESPAEVREALNAGADIIMLDNMPLEMLKQAVQLVSGKALLEASGGITLDRVAEVAETGVDFISVGELTNSIKALDISMDMVKI